MTPDIQPVHGTSHPAHQRTLLRQLAQLAESRLAPPACLIIAALAYLLLADLALNLFRSLVSKHWYESAGWADSDWAEAAAQRAAASVAALARLHDRYLMCRDPTVALKVAARLWAVATLGHFLRCCALLGWAGLAGLGWAVFALW